MLKPPANQPGKNILLSLTSIALLLGIGFLINNLYLRQESEQIQNIEKQSSANVDPTPAPIEPTPAQLPNTFKLTVAFTPQAPTANWDELHDTACEEVSSIIANSYFAGIKNLDAKYVEEQITKLTKWEDQNYGYHLDTTTQETARMISEVYKLQTSIVDISEEVIKKSLTENSLIILPANGQLLKNPYFQTPGPIYHMLVITGYNETNFITNDPGTKRGQNYEYSYGTLYNSNGSWSHLLGKVDLIDKKIIIVSKN